MVAQLCSVVLVLLAVQGVHSSIQAYGCEEDWTNYNDHCYTIVPGDCDSYSARNVCSNLGASPASVWSPTEMAFIGSLWAVSNLE
ncbi:hypothetical protein PoB_005544100 [Plakobranchus ocellatus]|uniref:Uncharacterized protein n=1 Tax=Plakobranchus ocellatus TaxID=259542 RepID=A0AAV4CC50_9GAST|nr:hypothetical protein PoB_005544100 [Plakobranchus ocellatus]